MASRSSTAMPRPATIQNLVAGTGVQVVQLATVNGCHLDAKPRGRRRSRPSKLDGLRLLFLENIGNLICPAEFPLGAKARASS